MIYIATVHWLDATWVDIQLDYFARHLGTYPYRVYAFLNGIEPGKYRERIYYIDTAPIVAHTAKLNLLAARICEDGEPEDIIYFIDGDAFPVGDIQGYVQEKLRQVPLVAVQRLENEGDPQPHPSFCATTVKFWREINGDWGQGPHWQTRDGRTRTDTGGLLWAKLKEKGIDWAPMLRSNLVNPHPLWFGLYQDLIYHHGAAFRTPYCMVDIRNARQTWWKRWLMDVADSRLGTIRGGWLQNAVYSFVMKKQIQKSLHDSREIITDIRNNPDFIRRFTGQGDSGENSARNAGAPPRRE